MKRSFAPLLAAAALLVAHPIFAQSVPEIRFESQPDLLSMPDDIQLGEAMGVATNSQGHLYVFTRSGASRVDLGSNRNFRRSSSRLFEFDANGKFVREIGNGLYAFMFAHGVRVDSEDNVWVVDEGSSMVVKFDRQGRVLMTMGRNPEALTNPGPRGAALRRNDGVGAEGDLFGRPTDVAWDDEGNIFVADGYNNARVAKFDKYGAFLNSWGSYGTGINEFNTLHSIQTDADGNVYVGDRGNSRIQVFDNDGNFKYVIDGIGAPWAICITPGPHQYLYSSNSAGTGDLNNGEVYKMELDGTIVGKFGRSGRMMGEFASIHAIDCRNENDLYVGEILSWRVQRLTLYP
jgi:hypothetical protein